MVPIPPAPRFPDSGSARSRRAWRRILLLIPLAATALAAPARADDYSQWAHGLDLYTNTSPDGAYVTATVRHFPLLVRLDSGNFPFAEARGKGQDIRFAGLTGGHLSYQIDRWDSAGAEAEVWVLADSIRGDTVKACLRMLWGNADAADSSDGEAVFTREDGYLSVWHLGAADTLPRANSVAEGKPATPVNYDGDESRMGVIGLADSLDGAGKGDYLDLGPGYADFSGGFTYSVWANPSNKAFWSRLLDMGNGSGVDNLVLQRNLTNEDLDFDTYNGVSGNERVTAAKGFRVGEWQHFTVTVEGRTASIYRNGILAATGSQSDTLPVVERLFNYIGKSNWGGNDYYMGGIDEPRLSGVPRQAERIKLEYANQRPSQNLVAFAPPTGRCDARFDVPTDTTLPEGSTLSLSGIADCAQGYFWAVVSGPAPRILDPETKDLEVTLPRNAGDYSLRYRFNARYGDEAVSKEVTVTVKEAVPEPKFSLVTGLSWNGRDSLLFAARISNLPAIRSGPDSILNWSWTLSGVEADTAWRADGLLLQSAPAEGDLKIGLCLDNGGPATCKAATVSVTGAAAGLADGAARAADPAQPAYDAKGRRLGAKPEVTILRAFPWGPAF